MVNSKLPKIYYGGDYNPDQWPPEVWEEDMRLLKLAQIDVATLPVFSWARLQPEEDRYEFGWLDDVVELLWRNGIHLCLATSTAAHPAWMARRYPDVLQVDFEGRKRRFGVRHNSCPNSPTYRRFAPLLAGKLAERYGRHPALLLWHVNNELGGACYCEHCGAAFQTWLGRRYGSLENLNERWYTGFWGHTFSAWEEIVPPNALSEEMGDGGTAFQAISLDYRRFMSDSFLGLFLLEREALKRITPEVPVTTNLMGHYRPLNYFQWAEHMDVVSWDSYPDAEGEASDIALVHDLMRGLKRGQPFLLMEQTPSQVNWQAHCKLKRPGVLRLWSHQAVAHGADAILYFQLRQSRGAQEKWHGAVISHAGHEHTRVFREVADLGAELAKLGDAVIGGRIEAEVAMFFDWESWWALELSSGPSCDLRYLPEIYRYYRALWRLGVSVDFVGPEFDLSKYRILIAPLLYLVPPRFAAQVEAFVASGGTFLTTSLTGLVDENDQAFLGGFPGPLRKVLGVWAEEYDALPRERTNQVVLAQPVGELMGSYGCGTLFALTHAESAEVVAEYGCDFYAGRPALTRNRFGQGEAWYVATHPEERLVEGLMAHLCATQGVSAVATAPEGVEVVRRSKGSDVFLFVLNHNEAPVTVDLSPTIGTDLLTGTRMDWPMELPGRGVWIVQCSRTGER